MREVYLDNSATTFPKPECVYQAVDRFMRNCGGSPGRASHRKSQEADKTVVKTRQALARLFKISDPSRIVFTCNCTESINLAVKGILQPGDHIVITDLEHNAVLRPLWKLGKTMGIDISIVETTIDGFLDPSKVWSAINKRTRLICAVYANNVLGTILPIGDLAEIANKSHIPLLVDASQAAGVIPTNVDAMNISLFAFTGHKGLLGPQGTGGLFIREGIEVHALKQGGTGIGSESPEQPEMSPEGYEPGTPNAVGIAGLGAAVEFIEMTGIEKIRSHEISLNTHFIEAIQEIKGIRIFGPNDPEKKVGITLVNFEALDPGDVGKILDKKFGIMVRSGLHCSALTHRKLGTERKGAVRFSFGYFNTKEDVDYAIEAIKEISNAIYH